MKNWIVVVVVLVAAGLGLQKWRPWNGADGTSSNQPRPTTAVVEARDIRFAVNAAGDIGPKEQVSVRPEVNGKIDVLAVDIGDQVRSNALLFTLDDRDLQIEKQTQDREVERARLQREQAERNYKRSKQLYEEKLISLELYEQTRTEFELAQNALQRAEKSLELVSDRLRKTRILAPFDCTVLTRPISVGQAVSGSGGFNSGTEVLTIADLHEMLINAHINQADVTRLKSGQQVEVEVEAVPGLKVTGTVERVAPQATIKNNIKGFATRILLKDVDRQIRPGMTANIKIPVASVDNVLAVPLAAVFTETNPDTGDIERYVYVEKGLEWERRPVTVGVSDFFFAEVQSGLSPGEVVALELPKSEQGKSASGLPGMQAGGGTGTRAGTNSGGATRPASTTGTSTSATRLRTGS
jgi:HlyD family secretion protein